MLKYWTATSLVALALLGCFVDQGVEAQGAPVLQPRLSIWPGNPSNPSIPPGHQKPSNPSIPPGQNPSNPSIPPGQNPSNPSKPPGQNPSNPSIPPGQNPYNPSTPPGSQRPYNPSTPPGSQRPYDPSKPPGSQRPYDPSKPPGSQRPYNPLTPPGSQRPYDPSTPPGSQRPYDPSKPPGSQRPYDPSTPPGSQRPYDPSKPPGSQRPYNPSTPPGSQRPYDPSTPPGSQRPYDPSTPPGSQRPYDPSKPPGSQRPYDPSKPPGSQRPYDPSKPPGSQRPYNPLTPSGNQRPYGSQNPPSLSKTPPKYGPRASPPGPAKVPLPIPYNPSQGSSHQTGVTKNPNQDTCEVAEAIKITCGTSDISEAACREIGCCFEAQRCYFGKAVTVQCTKDGQFIVVVAKDATLPSLDLNTISMYGEGQHCTHVDSNSEFAIYNFAVTQCGTLVREEDYGVITYENIMVSDFDIQSGTLGQITRDTTYNLFFQCRYTATSVHSLVIELLPSDPPQPVASIGPVRVQLQLANGQCTTKGCNEVEAAYTSFYKVEEYPVQKVLREPVYVQVEILEMTDPLVVLTLDHCWTTTSPNPHTYPQWDILINGCPNPADPYTSELIPVPPDVEFSGHYRRFLFKMFAFVDSVSMEPTYQQVYLHCSTSLCLSMPGSYCEPACFRKLKKREAKTTEKRVERNVVVTAGPVTISAPKI